MNPFKGWTPDMVEDYNLRKKAADTTVARRLGQERKPTPKRKPLLNKTEARFLAMLKAEQPNKYVGCQNITFRLAHDLRYTPDFWICPGFDDGMLGVKKMTFWEVKGPFIREDSMIKLKTAAAMFPMFTFILAQEQEKDGQWTTKTIPPLS